MLVMLFFAEFINKVPKYLRRTIHQRTFEPSPPKPGKELPKAAAELSGDMSCNEEPEDVVNRWGNATRSSGTVGHETQPL
ncbi:unnamed protein product [Zymoseptoria tritici ST99CH_3D1]|nr:unnamed protein product [Zymoseptoria tritici ST99CH_3D1]